MKQNILITGSSGYIGRRLIETLAKQDNVLLHCLTSNIDRFNSIIQYKPENFVIHKTILDAISVDGWYNLIKDIDIVFYLAGLTNLYAAEKSPSTSLSINLLPFVRLLEATAELTNKPFIVFASTITALGLNNAALIDESLTDKPISIYDLHKLYAEEHLKHYCRNNLARGTILRLANVYGTYSKNTLSTNSNRGVLNQLIINALTKGEITLFGGGTQLRDYVHIDDVIAAFIDVIQYQEASNGEHFLIGTGIATSMLTAANMIKQTIQEKTHKTINIIHQDWPYTPHKIELRNYAVNNQRFRDLTHWEPKIDLHLGLSSSIDLLNLP